MNWTNACGFVVGVIRSVGKCSSLGSSGDGGGDVIAAAQLFSFDLSRKPTEICEDMIWCFYLVWPHDQYIGFGSSVAIAFGKWCRAICADHDKQSFRPAIQESLRLLMCLVFFLLFFLFSLLPASFSYASAFFSTYVSFWARSVHLIVALCQWCLPGPRDPSGSLQKLFTHLVAFKGFNVSFSNEQRCNNVGEWPCHCRRLLLRSHSKNMPTALL